jgi:hypothetical protein
MLRHQKGQTLVTEIRLQWKELCCFKSTFPAPFMCMGAVLLAFEAKDLLFRAIPDRSCCSALLCTCGTCLLGPAA